MPNVLFTDPALGQFNSLEKNIKKRIVEKLKEITPWPDHFLKPLRGIPYFSLRVGDYRVIIEWRKERDELWVVAVGHRRNIYEKDL